jgi:S-layer protein (TIGR01564 family)
MSKWPKKVAAITTGALMLGATLAGAFAAQYDLADLWSPFVQNGALNNAVIVVGKNADVADVLGSIDLAAALQAAATTPVTGGDVVIDPSVTEGVKVEKSGDKFNYDDDIENIQAVYDDADLDFLEDVEVDDKDFEQLLTIGNGAAI